MASKGSEPDWLRLQKKIFTRWANQKLRASNVQLDDIVKGVSTGLVLIQLMEVLSDKKYEGKVEKNPRMRVQQIDNVNNALKFVWACGVQVKLKPSAEDLVDGNDKQVLGLIWAIMMKYMKIGDDEEGQQLSAKEALLMWVQNKINGYQGIKVEDFSKSFHDGLALCALIHKHRPKLIPWDTLNKENKKENLQLAMDAANKFFGLEKYLSVDDIPKLDENSMVVYVSEYYYGIYEQRKLDLAAKKIGKVIKLTKENDALKQKYNEEVAKWRELVTKVEKVLENRTIDNTLSGAKRRIEEFYEYKTNDKNAIIGYQLDLEALYNSLAVRLSHNKRPEFNPPSGLSLRDVVAAVSHLEECEQERKIALHAELNRQIRLLALFEQHTARYQKLKLWVAEKDAYLSKKETIDSVSGAQLQLRLLDAYDKESKGVFEGTVQAQLKVGKELVSEHYEKKEEVINHDQEIESSFKKLDELSKNKRPVLEDDLAREQFKARVRLMNQSHIDAHDKLNSWIAEKEAYLKTREVINSVTESRTQLSLLDSYDIDQQDNTESVKVLKSLGADILSSTYSTSYSSWSIENPGQISERESDISSKWELLSQLSAEKRKVLDDHLAREIFKEKVLTMNRNHVDRFSKLESWASEKDTYLRKEETINSIADANLHLGLLESYEKENSRVTLSSVSKFKKLGSDILAQKYETSYSSYVFETPDEVRSREDTIDSRWKSLSELGSSKRKTLESALAREIEKERLRLEFAHLASEFVRWSKETSENLDGAHFGFTLEEVESYENVLNQSTSSIDTESSDRKSGYESVFTKMTDLGVTENSYTTLTLNDLSKAQLDLNSAVDKRKNAYFAELKKQRDNDNLCKEFANHADPFSKWIIDQKDVVTRSSANLEDQLTNVNQRISDFDKDGSRLIEIKSLNDKMDQAGIINNRHTSLTAKDVEVQYEQYKSFMLRKKKMLEEEIEQQKLRGISAEQYKEIEDTFKLFDADNSGHIDKKELKACLYSLGEEKTGKQVDEILKEYGSSNVGGILYERFRDFMVSILAVTDTKEDILNAFKLINLGDEVAKLDKMEMVMAEDDVAYVKSTAPLVDGNYDYNRWTDDVFAR